MKVRNASPSPWVAAALLAAVGCVPPARVPPRAEAGCHDAAGRLQDTVYLREILSDASPPVPRRPHLAPYPPAAEGENRIWFRGAAYNAYGMPARAGGMAPGMTGLVRIGSDGAIPLFVRQDDLGDGKLHTLWAPITEDCVFLPFTHHWGA